MPATARFALLLAFALALVAGWMPVGGAHADDGDAAAEPAPDTVILTNGSVWVGRILKEDERSVVIEQISKTGGVGRYTFQRDDIKLVRRGDPSAVPVEGGGPRLVRDEWFLLRSSGAIVGTRRLELWSVRSRGLPGYRLEEKIAFFAQGPHLPATRTHRTEEVDQRFFPRLLAFREEGAASSSAGGHKRYSRNISGRVKDGVWRGSVFRAGAAHRTDVRVPTGARGRLGLREWLLRIPRRVLLLDARVVEPEDEAVVGVRAGFTSVTQDPSGRRPGHEFHWEEGGKRFISYFQADQRVVREEIAEGIVALPVSREQAEAAAAEAERGTKDPGGREIRLAEAGIAFTPPGPVWRWTARAGATTGTQWRVLGRLANDVLLGDVRVEWHPHSATSERAPAQVEGWLVRRLRAQCADLRTLGPRRPLAGVAGAWQIDLQGTLRRESVRSVAVVVDRRAGRVVLLLACPAAAWEQVRPALDRFLGSLRSL